MGDFLKTTLKNGGLKCSGVNFVFSTDRYIFILVMLAILTNCKSSKQPLCPVLLEDKTSPIYSVQSAKQQEHAEVL